MSEELREALLYLALLVLNMRDGGMEALIASLPSEPLCRVWSEKEKRIESLDV